MPEEKVISQNAKKSQLSFWPRAFGERFSAKYRGVMPNNDKKFYPYFCKILPQRISIKRQEGSRYNDQKSSIPGKV